VQEEQPILPVWRKASAEEENPLHPRAGITADPGPCTGYTAGAAAPCGVGSKVGILPWSVPPAGLALQDNFPGRTADLRRSAQI